MRSGLTLCFATHDFRSRLFALGAFTTIRFFDVPRLYRAPTVSKERATRAAFGQTPLALKIYSARYVHYRFSALIASAPNAASILRARARDPRSPFRILSRCSRHGQLYTINSRPSLRSALPIQIRAHDMFLTGEFVD